MDDPQPFKVDGWTVFKTLLTSVSGWPVWTAVAIGMILIAIGCMFDLRFVLTGLMIVVAVVPGIAAFLYFNHTLSPQVVCNMIPHTVERIQGGYLLRTWRRAQPPEGEDDDDVKEEVWVESSMMSLSDAKIVDRKTSFEYDLFYFMDSPLKILYVPRFIKYEDIKEHQP